MGTTSSAFTLGDWLVFLFSMTALGIGSIYVYRWLGLDAALAAFFFGFYWRPDLYGPSRTEREKEQPPRG